MAETSDPSAILNEAGCKVRAVIHQHDRDRFNEVTCRTVVNLADETEIVLAGSRWSLSLTTDAVTASPDERDLRLLFRCVEGSLESASLMLELEFSEWSPANHVADAIRRLQRQPLPHQPHLSHAIADSHSAVFYRSLSALSADPSTAHHLNL
jgi:hypothetical protein